MSIRSYAGPTKTNPLSLNSIDRPKPRSMPSWWSTPGPHPLSPSLPPSLLRDTPLRCLLMDRGVCVVMIVMDTLCGIPVMYTRMVMVLPNSSLPITCNCKHFQKHICNHCNFGQTATATSEKRKGSHTKEKTQGEKNPT